MDSSELRQRAEAWQREDPDPHTAAELQNLLERWSPEDLASLADRFAGNLEFGTAGLRGVVGAGPNRLNRAVVRRTTAGRMGATTYLVPPIAIVLAWSFLDETPPRLALAGGVLCLLGVALARGTRLPALRRRTPG